MIRDNARKISYSHSAQSGLGRSFIRAIENATGRVGLIQRTAGYDTQLDEGQGFWEIMAARFGLSLDVIAGSLEDIPRAGPLILVANHPFGILDGLMMGLILSKRRSDFRIIANDIFLNSDDLSPAILPISYDASKAALRLNIQTRKAAIEHLGEGGAIGIFPGGTVSTALKPSGIPLDPIWRSFTARMIAKSEASVVPLFFEGQTSRLFQIASHVHFNLRLGLLIHEFRKRIDQPVRVAIGKPIDRGALNTASKDSREMMDFLRRSTYELSSKPIDVKRYGFEFAK